MGAQLWFRIVTCVVLAWVVLTTYVVWRATGAAFPQLGHEYFWRWAICGVLTHTPVIDAIAPHCWLPANGSWYQIGPLTEWMNSREMYNLPFPTWFWHYAMRTALIPLGIGAAALVWRARRKVDLEHIRGLRLLSPRDHDRQLHGGWLTRIYTGRPGIQIGSSIIPERKEREHVLVTGNPGAGKSTLIRHMLHQIADRQQCAIVIDPEGEYVQEFYDEARGDILLNPLDARCPYWTPWSELRDDSFTVDAAAMAASLIRGKPRTNNEMFFQESTRTVIEAIFEVVQGREVADLLNFVRLPEQKMHEALEGTLAYAHINPDAAGQRSGILGTAGNAIKTFVHLPQRNDTNRTWSARQWSQSRKGWVFLPSQEDIRAAIELLQGLWLDVLVRWLMSARIDSSQVWVIADELASLGHQPMIEMLMTRGRKRGLAVTLGVQNVSQLRAIYGHEGAITLTSSPTTKVILRVDEPETAKWASELIGSREVERLQMTQLAGLSSYREGVNLQPHRSIEHLVIPAEIQLLEPFTGYLCVAGHDRTTITIPERHLDKRHPAFVRRTKNPAPEGANKPATQRHGWLP